jgi:hypothetical protein
LASQSCPAIVDAALACRESLGSTIDACYAIACNDQDQAYGDCLYAAQHDASTADGGM